MKIMIRMKPGCFRPTCIGTIYCDTNILYTYLICD